MLSNNFILIIQARYGSSRFRGKIMADICGKPLISRILQRVKKVKKVKKIIIATTKRKEDDILLDIAKQHKVEIFRGSENDLVDRYYKAVNKMNFKHILRLPADNALPEPSEYNRLINYHLSSKNDFFPASLYISSESSLVFATIGTIFDTPIKLKSVSSCLSKGSYR